MGERLIKQICSEAFGTSRNCKLDQENPWVLQGPRSDVTGEQGWGEQPHAAGDT